MYRYFILLLILTLCTPCFADNSVFNHLFDGNQEKQSESVIDLGWRDDTVNAFFGGGFNRIMGDHFFDDLESTGGKGWSEFAFGQIDLYLFRWSWAEGKKKLALGLNAQVEAFWFENETFEGHGYAPFAGLSVLYQSTTGIHYQILNRFDFGYFWQTGESKVDPPAGATEGYILDYQKNYLFRWDFYGEILLKDRANWFNSHSLLFSLKVDLGNRKKVSTFNGIELGDLDPALRQGSAFIEYSTHVWDDGFTKIVPTMSLFGEWQQFNNEYRLGGRVGFRYDGWLYVNAHISVPMNDGLFTETSFQTPSWTWGATVGVDARALYDVITGARKKEIVVLSEVQQ